MLHALADVLTSPLAVLILAALIVAVGAVEVAEARPHRHYLRRVAAGVWECTDCGHRQHSTGEAVR